MLATKGIRTLIQCNIQKNYDMSSVEYACCISCSYQNFLSIMYTCASFFVIHFMTIRVHPVVFLFWKLYEKDQHYYGFRINPLKGSQCEVCLHSVMIQGNGSQTV